MGGTVKGVRPDFNLGDGPHKNGATSRRVLRLWPTDIVFVGAELGTHIKSGANLKPQLPENPVARAYDLYAGVGKDGKRASWDLTAVLYAVRGGGSYWRVVEGRRLLIAENGTTRWRPSLFNVSPLRRYLEQTGPDLAIEQTLEELLGRPHP